MSWLGLLILLVIAAVAGAIAQALVGYSFGGCLVSTLIGLIGAYLGTWIARQFGLPLILPITVDGQTFPLVWAIIGSVILVAILALFMRPRVGRY